MLSPLHVWRSKRTVKWKVVAGAGEILRLLFSPNTVEKQMYIVIPVYRYNPSVGFFGWWRLHGSCILKGIKRTSSSAPLTDKHYILELNIWLWLVWGGFYGVIVMRNVQSALNSLCESALNAQAFKSLCSQVYSFTLIENGRAFY